jgi:flagellar basal-body rod protein FlgG
MSNGLLDIMVRSKNAMEAFEASLRVHTNNSANLSTSGYKAVTHSFKTVFNEVINEGYVSPNGNTGSSNPVQYGSGVTLANIKLDFSQGELGEGGALDCAIAGRGLFVIGSAAGEESKYLYTRNGEFRVDPTGQYIVDSSGRKLFGYSASGGGALAPLRTQGYTDLGWKDGGILVANYQAEKDKTGTAIEIGKVALADFVNEEGLTQHDGTSFEESVASGAPISFGEASTGRFGEVMAQQLEKSNVFFIGETIDSIEVQRAMSAVLTAIKTASDQISQVINKLSG